MRHRCFSFARIGNVSGRRANTFRLAARPLRCLSSLDLTRSARRRAAHAPRCRAGTRARRPRPRSPPRRSRAPSARRSGRTGLRGFFARRLDRTVATGLLLTLALAVTLVGGLVLGVLAVLVRRVAAIQHLDNSVAAWGYDHRSATSTGGLQRSPSSATSRSSSALAVVLVSSTSYRRRSRWTFLFLLVVLVGMELAQLGVKDLVGRLRPTLDPAAAHSGRRSRAATRRPRPRSTPRRR